MARPSIHISSATFSDGSTFEFNDDDIVVFVGPNNAGKSVALRNIRDKSHSPNNPGVVVVAVKLHRVGSLDDVIQWMDSKCYLNSDNSLNPSYVSLGWTLLKANVSHCWNATDCLGELTWFFICLLTSEERLKTTKPAEAIALTREGPKHPIHYMQKDDRVEAKISDLFKEAFGVDLIVHRNCGRQVPLYCGPRPAVTPPEDRASFSYSQAIEKLDKLEEQGDGMRAFVGVLLHSLVVDHSVVLIDEPEAFLHPPQARLLGRMLVKEAPAARQLFISTHSGDMLRGLLDAGGTRVRVVRLQRDGYVNITAELNNDGIRNVWGDSLLRHSNVLDGVFHNKVIICEGDADCRFYGAVADALFDKVPGVTRPDVMFIHCNGKSRVKSVVRSLRNLRVSTCAILDFDVLSDEHPLCDIFDSLGGSWSDVCRDWELVKKSIDSKKAEWNAEDVKNEILKELDEMPPESRELPRQTKEGITRALRKASPWSIAKAVGCSYIPSGDPAQAYARIIKQFQAVGLFIVEVGELERFVKSIGNHGPAWVSDVLESKDLLADEELEDARNFMRRIFRDELTSAAGSDTSVIRR